MAPCRYARDPSNPPNPATALAWKTYHLKVDMAGAVRNGGASLKGFTDEHGHPLRPAVVRDMFRLKIARGEKYLLVADPKECPDFDPVTGCPGHPCEGPE